MKRSKKTLIITIIIAIIAIGSLIAFVSGVFKTKEVPKDTETKEEMVVYEHDNDIWQKHYALITCIDRDDPKFESYKIAESFGFNIFSFYDLLPEATEDTESDIFNEFWLRSW